MIEAMFNNVVQVSLTTSIVILALLLFSPVINKRYPAKWSYYIWIALAARLVLPFNFIQPAALQLSMPPAMNETAYTLSMPRVDSTVATNTVAQQQAPAIVNLSFIQIAAILWLVGVLICLIYHLIGYLLFKKSVYRWCTPVKGQYIDTFNNLLLEMNIQRPIRIVSCRKLSSPMMSGILKPVIILPDVKFNKDQLILILKHELIHYKHHDIVYKLIIVLAQALHWFNPMIYFLSRESSRAMEKYCDDEVVKNKSMLYREIYSETILAVMKATRIRTTVFSTYFNISGGHKIMKDRFVNILNTNKKKKGITAAIVTLAFLMLSGMLVACNSTTTEKVSIPVEVVKQYLTATKNNDAKGVQATLVEDLKYDDNMAVISLEVIEVKEETNPSYLEYALESQQAKENGWTKDNFAFVYAKYNIQHDNELVPYKSGLQETVFELVRSDKESPWRIMDQGGPRY